VFERELMVVVLNKKRVFSAVITKGRVAFVAYCPELGVTSQGPTEQKAVSNLREAVELYLEDEDVQKMLRKNPIKPACVKPLILPA